MRATEGRDFDNIRAEHNVSQTETAADQTAVAEQFSHFVRRGIGRDIEIFGFALQQQITDTAADQIGVKT